VSGAAQGADPVSARYVEALFRLAQRQGALGEVDADVHRLAAELSSESVQRFLFDARVDMSERRGKLDTLLTDMHTLTKNFVGLLFSKRREQVLSGLGAAWRRRSLSERGAVEGIVQSARELGSGEVAELALALGRTLGKDVQLENQVVPDLVGGVRVFVDNRMLDCSVQGRLASLRQRMLSAPLAAAAG